MFLLILEDGSLRKTDKVSDDFLAACDDGILDVINLNTEQPLYYFEGEWHEIETQ